MPQLLIWSQHEQKMLRFQQLPDEEERLVMALPIFSYHSTVLERDTAAVP